MISSIKIIYIFVIIIELSQNTMQKILEAPLRYPILFTCNIRRTVHQSFGLSHYKHLRYHGLQLIPIITDTNSGIERRAAQLKRSIIKYLDKYNISKAHVVSHSLSGLDMRYALSSLGLAERVHSLTTIATPHKGSKFADMYDKKHFDDKISATILRTLGVYGPPLVQAVAENMRDFNQVVLNDPNVKYFSIGAEKHPQSCTNILKQSCKFIREKTINHHLYENDGINGYNEVQWGKHLVNFDYDHFQVIGMDQMFRGEPFHLVRENLGYVEAMDFKKEEVKQVFERQL